MERQLPGKKEPRRKERVKSDGAEREREGGGGGEREWERETERDRKTTKRASALGK